MKKLAIAAMSLFVIALNAPTASAEQSGCYLADSYCSNGNDCCSHICETHTIGHATCKGSA